MSTDVAGPLPVSLAARGAYWLTLAAVACVVLSTIGHRVGLWDEKTAIPLFGIGLVLALLAIIIGLVGVVRASMSSVPVSGNGKAITSILVSIVLLGIVAVIAVLPALNNPPIHDVTTSPIDAPEFVALAEIHYAGRDYKSYTEYDDRTEGMVKGAYPALRPLLVADSVNKVFATAEATAAEMGWEIAEVVPAEGRIEATDTTPMFGYKDDVVIRVRLSPNGQTEVDVRSASRVGESDLGKNASRIAAFLEALKENLS